MADKAQFPAQSDFLRKCALKLWPQVYGYVLSLVKDQHHAEDLSQEVYLKLFTMNRSIDSSRSILPLLLTIARNLVISQARRRKESDPLSGDEEDLEQLGPEAAAQDHETQDQVQGALLQLSPLWRSVLYLRDGLGFSYQEIASLTQRTEHMVRTTLHRARHRIRTLLKGLDQQERNIQ